MAAAGVSRVAMIGHADDIERKWPGDMDKKRALSLIDERGQARDVEWKMEIAHRIHRIATERYDLTASDLMTADPITIQ